MTCISVEQNISSMINNSQYHQQHRSNSSITTIGNHGKHEDLLDDWQVTVQQSNIKQKSIKIREPAFTLFVVTPVSHLTLARTLEEIYCFDQTLRATYPTAFKDLSPPSILTSPMVAISTSSSTLRFGRSPRPSTPAMSSTSTLMPASASAPKPKSAKKHMFHSISRTLSPALSKSAARKHRSAANSALALPTPPHSPNRNCDSSLTRSSSEPSDDDDFVDVQLSESEKQYVSQIEVGNDRQENQLGRYLTNLAQRPLSSSRRESLQMGGKRMSKLMKDGKEWQAFFKIGKDDFERERKLPKRDSHSLASSLKHHSLATVTSGKSPKPQDQEDGVDSLSIMAPHPASMKRVKSDQIVYNQPGNSSVAQDTSGSPILQDQSSSPIQEISPPSEQVTPPIPLSPPIEESPSVRSRNSLEAELGLSPADADAINRLTKNLEDEDLAHLANAGPSVTSPPQSLSPPSPSMKSLPPNSPSIKGSAYNSVPASIAPSHLAESPAVVPPPSSADPPTESSPSNRSPVQRRRHKVTVADFDIMRVLGKGCAGKVLMVKYRRPGGNHPSQVYAMKSIKKNHVLSHRELQHTLTEQSVLRRVADEPESNPFIVRLWWSFHDKDHLFLVMDFHPGGDLATQLARWGRLGRDRARFYAAEITEGVTSLHRSGVIYRDLKPENILIAFDGHIVLTDFGLSKQFGRDADGHRISDEEEERTLTFCGTAEYLAPEVLLGESYSYEVDWWSFGTMLYEMLTGLTPFWSEDHATMYRRVLHDELVFSEDSNRVMDHDTKTLLRGLLQRNPAVRMTGERIKKHPYFGMIDWDHVQHKRYIPPFVPAVNPNDATDTQNFDETFLAMEPTYVQDDDPPHSGAEEKKKEENEEDAGEEGEEAEGHTGKIQPQGAVDENGQDVFDGYSYLAPSHERDSIILEDEETESVVGGGNGPEVEEGTASTQPGSEPNDPASQASSPQSAASTKDKLPSPAHPPTTIVVHESEEPDLPTSNEEDEAEEDWDVVMTPENGQSDLNGRLGRRPGNTLFARGVVDKYKLRMRKLNEGSIGGGGTPSLHAGSLRPFGSSKSSFIKAAQSQFNSVGNQSTMSSIHQASSEASYDASGGKTKKRFGLRSKKPASSANHVSLTSADPVSGSSHPPASPPVPSSCSPSKKLAPGHRGRDLAAAGALFLKKNLNGSSNPAEPPPLDLPTSDPTDPDPSSSSSAQPPPPPIPPADLAAHDEHADAVPGGMTVNPRKKKALVAGLL
ncbi:hypothetical protein PCASD_11250 [Puccinia coronata f. sp. avenae]|uniref:Protein kinase domain-containing protein n=2 Tax=Puccinia coronata f. sp. avenae TaxID=200324 RepID=A0A2N5UBQ7_9BASI|nr:hypothetical protein PCASD_11250 [Puccinia coronata f. sp. avenae]